MGPIGCPKTVATSYNSTLCSTIEERTPQLKVVSSGLQYSIISNFITLRPVLLRPRGGTGEWMRSAYIFLLRPLCLQGIGPGTSRLQRFDVDYQRKFTRLIHNELYTVASTSQVTLVYDSWLMDKLMFKIC